MDGDAANGITRNPWDPRGRPGALGRVGGGRRRRADRGGDRLGRRRLDSDPGGVLRPGRDEADPRARGRGGAGWLGLSTYGALARTVADSALMLDVMHGPAREAPPRRRLTAATWRPPPRLRSGCGSPSRPSSHRGARPGAAQRAAWERTAALLGPLGTTSSSATPTTGWRRLFAQMWVRGIHEDCRRPPGDLERSTRQMASAGRSCPTGGARLCCERASAPPRASSAFGTNATFCSRPPGAAYRSRPTAPTALARLPSTSPRASRRSPRCST